MNEPTNNGTPEVYTEGGFCNDNVVHFDWDEDDPDAIEEFWPNCRPSADAFPPKKDEVRETLTDELLALMNAMNAYKRERGRQYLLWDDVLDVLHDLGYRKVAPRADAPAQPEAAKTTTP